MARIYALILTVCLPAGSGAQAQSVALPSLDSEKAIHQYVHDVWQAEDGLPNYAINDILRTSEGYLWLATHGGAVRFDGVRFKVFNKQNTPEIKNSFMTSLVEDRGGALWLGSRGSGLLRYQHGRFTRLTTEHGLPDNVVLDLVRDLRSGGLWIGTAKGVSYLENDGVTRYSTEDGLPESPIRSLAAARGGGLWVGTANGDVARFEDGKWTAVEVTHPPQQVLKILEDRTGQLWLGLATTPIRRFDGYRWIEHSGFLRSRAIYEDRAGTIWAGSDRGLIRFEEETFTAFTSDDGLTDPRVFSLHEDHEGNLWIGTYSGGLNRLKNGSLTTFTVKDGLVANTVHSICEDAAGNLWIGTDQGLTRLKDGQFTIYTTRDGLVDGRVLALYEDRDRRFWVGTTRGGLHRFDGMRFNSVAGMTALGDIRSLVQDRAGTLWIGAEQGLYSYEDGVATYHPPAAGLSRSSIHAVQEDRAGRLWVGMQHGLAYYEAGGFIAVDGLREVWIRALYEDEEATLWIGTVGAGLYRWRAGKLTHYTTVDGLPDDYVWDILEDGQKKLWMISDQGIFAVPRKELDDYALGKIDKLGSRRFDTTDGMRTTEGVGYVHPGAVKARDGAFWFPTMLGAVRIDPDRLVDNRLPPPVAIESLVVDGRVVAVPSPLVLSPDQRDLEIHYTGLALRHPDKVRFKVRLQGYAESWTDVGSRRVAYYTNLPPGAFVFQVIAANEDGVWSQEGASLAFTRRPAITETRWFYGLCILAAVIAGIGAFKSQAARMEKKVKREREAAERERQVSARLREVDKLKDGLVAERTAQLAEREHLLGERERLIAELESRNAELARFNYTVAHDLKNPLTTIRNFVSQLERHAEKGDHGRLHTDLRRIDDAALKLHQLLEALYEFSRIDRVSMPCEEVALGELVRRAAVELDPMLAEHGVEVEVAADLPVVCCDRARMLESVRHLLVNAVQYLGDQPAPRIKIGVCAEASDAEPTTLYVRDNGMGIDPRYHDKVFGLFERLDPEASEGTGIGLALVKRIVEVHGGRIWVESEGRGRGSTFFFTLPRPG